jgi:hypothetical protein
MSHTNINHDGLKIWIFFWTLVYDFSLVIEVHYFPYCSVSCYISNFTMNNYLCIVNYSEELLVWKPNLRLSLTWHVYFMAVTWNVTCTYSQFLAQKTPTCCVSLSSFYNDTIVDCPTCTCGCQNKTQPDSCVK